MKINYDPQADALYIKFQEGESARTKRMAEGILIDLDEKGLLYGIEVLGAKGIEYRVEAAEFAKKRHAHHHCATAGDAGRHAFALAAVDFLEADRIGAPEPEIDPAAAAVVDARGLIEVQELALRLPDSWIGIQRLEQSAHEARPQHQVIVQEQQVLRLKSLPCELRPCIAAGGHAQVDRVAVRDDLRELACNRRDRVVRRAVVPQDDPHAGVQLRHQASQGA